MKFYTTRKQDIAFLRSVLNLAYDNGQSIRLDIDGAGRLKVKVGESMWSAPIYPQPDPNEVCNHNCTPTPENTQPNASHFLDCPVWKEIL